MDGPNPKSTFAIGGHPLHPLLVPFPIVCFVGALVTDIIFSRTGDLGWATASRWLLGFGLGTAALAAAAGLIDFMGDDRIRRMNIALRHMIANVSLVVIELINLLLRLRDPEFISNGGLILSAIAVLVLLYSGWLGGEMVFRHRVGVHDDRGPAPDRTP